MTVFLASIETRGLGGEPEWLPAQAEVDRERARLVRLGALTGLRRDTPWLPATVPPGETPWSWWLAAALWLVVWPALIALRASGRLAFVPWWWLPLLAGLHMLALAWPVWQAMHGKGPSALRRRFDQVQTLTQMLALAPEEFEVWSSLLFQLMGYQVRNTRDSADHGIDLEVSDEALALGLVQCKRHRGTVGEPTVRDLYGTLVAAQAGRAWLLTTGAISRQAREWAAGKPIELWDGRQLVAVARKCRRA